MADNKLLFAGIGLLVGGLLSLATSAIGTQCYNDNEEYNQSKGSNKSFLVFNLVIAILIVMSAVASIYYSFKKTNTPAAIIDIGDVGTSTADVGTSIETSAVETSA
jgi:hypothetical protein